MKRSEVVSQLKQMQAETEPIVKILEDDKVSEQIQNTRQVRCIRIKLNTRIIN